jgi:carbohydrate diacid regulator
MCKGCDELQLVTELAKKIINEVQRVISENIIVVNQEAIIIASTDQSRVGSFHEGAGIVMISKEKLYITSEMVDRLKGVKAGITLPIFFETEVIGVIGITGIPADVEPIAELIRRMTELIIREAYYIAKKEWETRGLESFCYEWIYTSEINDDFINRGQILGVSFDTPYQCILFQVDTTLPQETLKQIDIQMGQWFKNQFPRTRNDLFVRWGNGRFILMKSVHQSITHSKMEYELVRWQESIKRQSSISLAIGVGKSIEQKSISRSYQEAKKALKVAEKEAAIIFYESLLLEMILEEVNESTQFDFLSRVLSSIQDETELLDTLRTFFANNQSLKKTADDLHIHINTLHYRLKQVKEMTGINPKSVEGVTLFYIALSFLSDKHTKKHF